VAHSQAAQRGLERAAERAPIFEWRQLRKALAETWQPGEHVSVFGPTGRGKTTVLIELCELPGHQPAVLLVTKRRDDMVRRLTRRGWILCRSLEDVKRTGEVRLLDRWAGLIPPPPKIVYWPTATGSIKQRRARLTAECERFFDYAYDQGHMTVAVDEALYVAEDLRLGASLRTIWHEGRASGVSLLAASQRPSWLPKSAYSSPTYLAIFRTNDPDDLRRLADIGGAIDTRALRLELQLLDDHEFAFCVPRDVPAWICRSTISVRRAG